MPEPEGFFYLLFFLSQPDRESREGYTGRGLGFAPAVFPGLEGVLRTQSLLGGSSGGYNFLVLVYRQYRGVSGVRDTLCVLTDFNREI